jgi:hypothetical protein
MRKVVVIWAAILVTCMAGACRPQPETPRVPPSPTNPTNTRSLAYDPTDAIPDASILPDAGPTLDAATTDLDTGASAPQP